MLQVVHELQTVMSEVDAPVHRVEAYWFALGHEVMHEEHCRFEVGVHGTDSYLPLVHEVQLVHCVLDVDVHCLDRYLPLVHELHELHCVSLDR